MATSKKDWSPESSRVKFQLLGTPTLSLATGTNKNGDKVWFDGKKAKKFEIPDNFVVKYKSGKGIDGGRIRWDGGRRVISFAADEKDIIESLYYSPYCQNGPNATRALASFVMIDDEKEKREKFEALKHVKKAIQLFINTPSSEMMDIAVCLGFDDSDAMLYESNVKAFVDKNPDGFMAFFNAKKDGTYSLKEEYRIQALVRRAQRYKVLEVNKGAYYYKGDLIGADLAATVLNLMNSTDGSQSAKSDAVPLIIEALKKKGV